MKENLIKSKKRVKEHGEVFTPEHIVKDMLNLLPEKMFSNPLATFLEPACGNGNFLVEILKRKLSYSPAEDYRFYILKCVSSIYAIDIQKDNVEEAQSKLFDICLGKFYDDPDGINEDQRIDFEEDCLEIIRKNIVVGNSLIPESINFYEYSWFSKYYSMKEFKLSDLIERRVEI